MARVILREERLNRHAARRGVAEADAQLRDFAGPLRMAIHRDHRVADLFAFDRLEIHAPRRAEVRRRGGGPLDERLGRAQTTGLPAQLEKWHFKRVALPRRRCDCACHVGHGCVCGGVSAPGEVLRGLCLDVAHADDLMRGCDALQGVEVSASHMAGADEGDSEHRHRPLQDQSQAQEQKPAEAGEGPVACTPQRAATSRSQPAARMLRHQPASWFST